MKKLKLRALELGATEMLTRAQLKNIFGGDDGSGSGDCPECVDEACSHKNTADSCLTLFTNFPGTCTLKSCGPCNYSYLACVQ